MICCDKLSQERHEKRNGKLRTKGVLHTGGANSSSVGQQQTTAYTSLLPAVVNSTTEALLLYTMVCKPHTPTTGGGSPGCDPTQNYLAFSMAITLNS